MPSTGCKLNALDKHRNIPGSKNVGSAGLRQTPPTLRSKSVSKLVIVPRLHYEITSDNGKLPILALNVLVSVMVT